MDIALQTFYATIAQCAINGVLLVVTIISVVCAFRAYKHQKLRAKKDSACELARYYSEHIIHRYGFVNYVLSASGVGARINTLFPYDDIKALDLQELCSILEKAEVNLNDVEKELTEIDPQFIYRGKILVASSVEERHSLAAEYISRAKQEDGSSTVCIAHGDILQLEFHHEVTMLLNDLEWFAMSCHYGLADEKMLYQSLHQTFISHIWLLYYYICRQNTCNENKLFTNIIWLFNLWKDRLRDLQKDAMDSRTQIEQEVAAAEQKCAVAIKEAEAARQKMKATRPEVYTGDPLK